MEKHKVIEAVKKLLELEKRKFNQSIDLLINLRNFDIKKDSVNLFLDVPHKIKDVKIGAFLEKKSSIVDTITKTEFESYKDKRKVKKIIRDYDFFIASAKLMPLIASTFGRYLGPAGKMPSPQLGIIKEESEKDIKEAIHKFEKVIRVKSKEPSLKFSIGNEQMSPENVSENIETAYNTILNALPRKKENLKSIMIKLTMSKPIKLEF